MNKHSILVVEDEALIAANIVETLSSLGYTVHEPVAKGEDAIRAVNAQQPDLVLMDIQLIGAMNGIEAAEKIRAIADIPIVYLTAQTDDLRLKQAQLTEPYGYIVKPVHRRELNATIEMALYKHALDRKLKESEERNRFIVEALPGIIFRFSADGRFIDCQFNKGDLLLLPPDQMIGKQVTEILPPDLAHLTERKIRETLDSGQLQTFEYSLTLQDQEHFFEARMITSGINSVLAFVYDITERKKAEEALRESETKHRALFESIADTVFLIDQKTGNILDVNPAANRQYGFDHDEFVRMNAVDVSAEPEQTVRAIERPVSNIPLRYHHRKDGSIFPVELTASTFELQGKTIIIATARDITERKRAEDVLNESESFNRGLVENLPEYIIVYGADGKILYVNPATERALGYNVEELVGTSVLSYIAEEHREDVISTMKLRKEGREVPVYETVLVAQDGHRKPVIVKGTPIRYHDGPATLILLVDITDRKRVEEALRESEEVFREVFNNANDAIFLHELLPDGLPGHYFRVNDIACKRLGYSSEELYKMSPRDIVSTQHNLNIPDIAAKLKSKGYGTFETVHQRKDGSTFPVEINTHIFLLQGRQVGLSIVRDITERKLVDNALRDSEEKFKQLFTRMPSAVAIYDAVDDGEDFIIKDFNTAAEKIEGIKKDDLIGKRVTQVFPGVKDFGVFAVFQRVWRTGQPEFFPSAIYRDERDPGTWRESWVYKLASGEIISIYNDITERKRAESALTESFAIFKTVMDSLDALVYVADMKTHEILFINQYGRKIFGDITGKICWESLQVDQKGPCPFCTNEKIRDSDGNPTRILIWEFRNTITGQWFECHDSAIRWTDGRIVRIEIASDITERKRIEGELRESETRFRTIIHSMQFGIVIIDANTHAILDANDKALEMIGGSNESVSGSVCHRFICPAELGKCPVTDLGQTVDSSERVILTMRGGRIPILKSVVRTNLGGKEVLIESFIDITERKRAEETLRESEERYRNVVEDQTEFICRFLPDGTHVFVNDAYCRYFDKKREEIIGHRFRPVILPEDREIVARHLASITPDHLVMDIDHRIIMTNGSIRWQRWSDRAIFDPDGRVIEYQSVGRDITEQKELEKEMEFHTQELRKFSTSLTAANKKLNLLSSITRHDITNQLTVLVGYLRILEKKQPDTSFSEYFNKINTSAQRITAMLQFTKEYDKIGVNAPVWQDTRTLVNSTAKEAPLGKVLVKNDLPAGAEVFADPLVVKVFYNLMDNAARYGGKITTIRFFAEESADEHLIVCEDDGDGVVAGEKEKIFERGFGKNTGLGLALSREIFDITGITIRENGEPGKGARFEMTVPKGAYRSGSVQ